jgi:hypothetical protein
MLSTLARRIERHPGGTHPALWSFAEECRGLLARLLGYMGALALIAMAVMQLWDEMPLRAGAIPGAQPGWSLAGRSYPAFAVSRADSTEKLETYEIFRHPEGGRKDILRWAAAANGKPVAKLELYRPGAEVDQVRPSVDPVTASIDPVADGVIETKFGPVTLRDSMDRGVGSGRCLGFTKNFEASNLRISGWSCHGETLPARRAAIACTLNRLTLLSAGNDPKLAELFARAELNRAECASGQAAPVRAVDWVAGTQNPRLRGSM